MQEELIISLLFNYSLRNAVMLGVQQLFTVKHQLTAVHFQYKIVFLPTLSDVETNIHFANMLQTCYTVLLHRIHFASVVSNFISKHC